jgi:membrane carboxypeptidase/penicillin-binding protein
VLVCLAASLLFYFYILSDLPSPRLLTDSPPSLTTRIYDRNGILLYQIYKDENRTLIKLGDLPKHMIDATLAAEDKDFYGHHGISLTGIVRALANTSPRHHSGRFNDHSTASQNVINP